MQSVHIIISGDVQGVGFRAWVVRHAQELGVSGWVKNRGDGAVEVVAEGIRKDLEELVKRCRSGPDVAWVENVDARWEDAEGKYGAFDVVY